MIFSFFGLAIALQTVAQMVQDLGHFGIADRMLASAQGIGDGARTLAGPAQRRFRIASRRLLDHRLQPVHKLRVGLGNRLAPASRTANTTGPS